MCLTQLTWRPHVLVHALSKREDAKPPQDLSDERCGLAYKEDNRAPLKSKAHRCWGEASAPTCLFAHVAARQIPEAPLPAPLPPPRPSRPTRPTKSPALWQRQALCRPPIDMSSLFFDTCLRDLDLDLTATAVAATAHLVRPKDEGTMLPMSAARAEEGSRIQRSICRSRLALTDDTPPPSASDAPGAGIPAAALSFASGRATHRGSASREAHTLYKDQPKCDDHTRAGSTTNIDPRAMTKRGGSASAT